MYEREVQLTKTCTTIHLPKRCTLVTPTLIGQFRPSNINKSNHYPSQINMVLCEKIECRGSQLNQLGLDLFDR
jgi:hypothetical protein